MPAVPPVAFATIAEPLPGLPYIFSITPTSLSGHLVLQHPEPELTIADAQTLQAVDYLRGAHTQGVTGVRCEQGNIWTSSKDATIVQWDERSRRPASTIKAFLRKPLPVTALEVSTQDNLVIGGTELLSSEAHIMFWDIRNSSKPAYMHSSTHSDDITRLSLLPPTAQFQASAPGHPLPGRLLLSTATDGCIALSDMRETDEQEALQAAENWNESIAAAGWYEWKGRMKLWARSDMDNVALWNVGVGEEGELELEDFTELKSDNFKFKSFDTPKLGPNVVGPAMQDKAYPPKLKSDYLIDVCPSLGVSKDGNPMVAVGTNDGNIVIEHAARKANVSSYNPSAFFVTGPGQGRGHKDVVRCMYHAQRDEALYTGSEDGVLAGFSLSSLPSRLVSGDPDVDDDGGDGREDIDSDDESEIETESSEEDSDRSDSEGMDISDEEPKRPGPTLMGRRTDERKNVRKSKRHAPY